MSTPQEKIPLLKTELAAQKFLTAKYRNDFIEKACREGSRFFQRSNDKLQDEVFQEQEATAELMGSIFPYGMAIRTGHLVKHQPYAAARRKKEACDPGPREGGRKRPTRAVSSLRL